MVAQLSSIEPPIDQDPPDRNFGDDGDHIPFSLFLPKESLAGLEELRKLTGKSSIAETVQNTVELYQYILDQNELPDEGNESDVN